MALDASPRRDPAEPRYDWTLEEVEALFELPFAELMFQASKAIHIEPHFDHYAPGVVEGPGWHVRVFLGELLGEVSPVPTATPLLGAEIVMEPEVVSPE